MEERKRTVVIAIDGPAGSGKTTTAKEVARRLGFLHLDTGAMYRAIALQVLRQKCDLNDREGIARIAASTDISIRFAKGVQRVFLGGEDVTAEVRSAEVTQAVTPVCEVPAVRRLMVEIQRRLGTRGDVVVEGRDIGTVVFPDADLKIFMTASIKARSERRQRDFSEAGENLSGAEIEADLERRDLRDANRTDSPLEKAQDAVVLDTTELTFEEQVARIIELYRRKFGASAEHK